jgi:hypothetical protein
MKASEKVDMVSASLFAVHRDLENPRKDAKGQAKGNPNYRYLSLPALIDHLRPKLKDAQLFVTQEVAGGGGYVEVLTIVHHFSGQWLEFGPAFMPAPGDAQAVGSAITYCRRYALAAVFNLAADADDDANRGTRAPSSARAAALGESTAEPNTAPALTSSSGNGEGAQAAAAASPSQSVTGPARPVTDGAPAGDVTIAHGEGATSSTPAGAPHYLSKDDQGLLAVQFDGRVKALNAYKARFGERITRLADITYDMRDEMEGASA